jgi:rod shape-determining protein MreD
MKLARWILLGLLAATVQAGFVPCFEIAGAIPDLALLATIFAALFAPASHVLPLAWYMGTLEDLLSSGRFGVHGAAFLAVAFLVLDSRKNLFVEHSATHLLVTGLHALALYMVLGAASAARHDNLALLQALGCGFGAALYTTALTFPVFALARRITGTKTKPKEKTPLPAQF